MSDENRIDPILGEQAASAPSILDETNATPAEETAVQPEKVNPVKLLGNKHNKKLLIFIIVIAVIAVAVIGFSITKVSQEVSGTNRLKETETASRQLPSGNQTVASLQEVDKYNDEISSRKGNKEQPLAPELGAIKNAASIDFSFDDATKEDVDLESGCLLNDTACMRAKKRIGPDECAPRDIPCLQVLAARGASQKTEVAQVYIPTEHELYLNRLNDPEYVKVLADTINKRSTNTKQLSVMSGGVVDYPQEASQEPQTPTGSGAADDNAGLVRNSGPEVFKMVDAGERFMGTADIALNSDIEGAGAFTVFSGQYGETKMIGTAQRVSDFMRVKLNNWVLPDGRECKIDAIALDKETTYAAIASEVDHHILYRYGWWGLGAVLSAYGKGAEENAKSTVIVVDGTAIHSTEKDADRELKIAVGQLGREIGDVMKRRLDRPSTVLVHVNETVGIFFMKPVSSSDCKFGGVKYEQQFGSISN